MKMLNSNTKRRAVLPVGTPLLVAVCCVLLALGCGKGPDAQAPGDGANATTKTRLKVAYIGITCEAPIFVAYEKGFFDEEDLDVELVKTDWDGLRDGLGLGRFDANHTLIMYLLKPIEQGLDVKITGGIHTGCLRVQAGADSKIQSVEDLRGKRIGIPTMGSPPFLFASRVLAAHGMDPQKDVTWLTISSDVMELAIANGQVDAVANSEPIGSILLAKEKVRTVADQAVDAPYCDEYCCAAVVSGKLAKENPEAAAKLTRALLKASKWVGANPTAAAELSVENKYIAASKEINAQAISKLKYVPGVEQCRQSIDLAAKEMKTAGLLNSATDADDLARKAWLDLDGVSDDWVGGLEVEHVAGGGMPPALSADAFAALFDGQACCACCCMDE